MVTIQTDFFLTLSELHIDRWFAKSAHCALTKGSQRAAASV